MEIKFQSPNLILDLSKAWDEVKLTFEIKLTQFPKLHQLNVTISVEGGVRVPDQPEKP